MAAIAIKDLNKTPKERSHLYSDLELDLIIDYTKTGQLNNIKEQKDIRIDYDINAIKNSIYNIFTTIPGQKILNPVFGLNLMYFLFSGISETNGRLLGEAIVQGIRKYEYRVELEYVNVITDIENQQYTIELILSVPSLNIKGLEVKGTLAESGFYFT
jgi:phage baseplate assembly protein W